MLQDGANPDITRDGVNSCFIQPSEVKIYPDLPTDAEFPDGNFCIDPRNMSRTYAQNSKRCVWNKRNARNYEKSHDSGWKLCMPGLWKGSVLGKGTIRDTILLPDDHGL